MVRKFNKYLSSIGIASRQQLAQRGQLIGRFILFFFIIYLFHQVFQSVKAPPERLWYLAITEWIVLSIPYLSFQIADDIRNGQVVYFMLRPLHYLALRYSECFGGFLVRYSLLGICCLIFCYSLTHFIPGTFSNWVIGVFIGILSALLYSLLLLIIGLFSFWLKEIRPLVYLNSTATFCFGGLIVPLSFYSEPLRTLCFYTPYPWILWLPAGWITGESIDLFYAFLGISVWAILLLTIISFLYQKCLNSFIAEGG